MSERKRQSRDRRVTQIKRWVRWLCEDRRALVRARGKLLALLYNILPSTTAVFSYAVGYKNYHPTSSFVVVVVLVVLFKQ